MISISIIQPGSPVSNIKEGQRKVNISTVDFVSMWVIRFLLLPSLVPLDADVASDNRADTDTGNGVPAHP